MSSSEHPGWLQHQHPALPAAPAASQWMPPETQLLVLSLPTGMGKQGWELPHRTLFLQVTPFPEAYRETVHTYKISEQDTDVRANIHPAQPLLHPVLLPLSTLPIEMHPG